MLLKRTYAEVDLGAIRNNLMAVRKLVGPDRKILLAIKSDGYGHGACGVSVFVEKERLADMFGVATPDEGAKLRDEGIRLPILNLGLVVPGEAIFNTIVDYDIAQTVADASLAGMLSDCAKQKKKKARVHLKVDTGMGRIGCPAGEAVSIAKKIGSMDNVILEGIFTHFPVSDSPGSEFTLNQIKIFNRIIEELESQSVRVPIKHCANSGGVLFYPESYYDMVRPGIMVYGYTPSGKTNGSISLIPSMTLKSTIVFIKRVKAGTPLSYGLSFSTARDSNIATIPVGYGDGYSRFLSNRGSVMIRNKEYPVVGRVTMDQILADLGDDEFPIGECVILFGKQGITAETISQWMGTISYEVICAISKRVPRIYTGEQE